MQLQVIIVQEGSHDINAFKNEQLSHMHHTKWFNIS